MGNAKNNNISSTEEQTAAKVLRDRNLARMNELSDPVVPRVSFYTKYGKRILDITIALPAFIVLLPVNVLLGICTYFDVGRPIFFKQTRMGKDAKSFQLIKFRNMTNETDEDGDLLPPSQRVTKFGKFVRKTSLDELLNIWSIVKGDMSIIGPRPQPLVIYERMSDRHKSRTMVKPGLECPRMIHVAGEQVCAFQRTFENDVWYVENMSLFLDLKMAWQLVKMVFAVEKRSNQAAGKNISFFVGYNDDGIAVGMNWYREHMEQLEL